MCIASGSITPLDRSNKPGTLASALRGHIEARGRDFFTKVCELDLEGIVCKRKDSPHKVTEKPSRHWIKVKNSRYGLLEGREELFEESRTTKSINGWQISRPEP